MAGVSRKVKQTPIRRGFRRLYRDGRSKPAVFHDRYLKQLRAHFGELDGVAADYAELVSFLRTTLAESMRRYATASDQRETGKGRRPNLVAVGRLSKRAALDFASFDQALRRLEALATKNGPHPINDLAARLLAMPTAAGQRDDL